MFVATSRYSKRLELARPEAGLPPAFARMEARHCELRRGPPKPWRRWPVAQGERTFFTLLVAVACVTSFLTGCRPDFESTTVRRSDAESDSPRVVSVSYEDRRLEELTETYVNERLRFYPVESTLAGISGHDNRLGSFSRGAINARVAWLVDFHQRLGGLDPSALSKPAHIDALWLTSLVKAEIFELETRRPWASNASFYAEKVREGLVALLLKGELGDGIPALLSRLEGVPAIVDEARANLEPPAEIFRDEGLRSIQVCRSLVQSLPALLDGRTLPASMEALRRVSGEAEVTLAGLYDHVRSLPKGETSATSLGREGLEAYWRYQEMVGLSLEEVERRAGEHVLTIDSEITALGLSELDGRPREQLFANVAPSGDIIAVITETLEGLRREILARHGGEADAWGAGLGPDVPSVRATPAPFVSPDFVRLWQPATLEPLSILLVSTGEPRLSASTSSERVVAPDARDLRLLTLREGVGRVRLRRVQSSARSLLRRLFDARTTAEGWLYLHSARLLEEDFLGSRDDPSVRLRALQRRLVAFLKLIGVIRYHRDSESLEDVERYMRERGGLPLELARGAAIDVAKDPRAGSVALGVLLLSDLARDYSRRFPLVSAEELEGRLLAAGVLPVPLVRFHLLSSLPRDEVQPSRSQVGPGVPGLRGPVPGL